MIRTTLLATSILLAGLSAASAAGGYDYWRSEACGNGGISGSKCEQAFRRLCGRTPNAACVARHRKVFRSASSFSR